jgi:hypothetical protein
MTLLIERSENAPLLVFEIPLVVLILVFQQLFFSSKQLFPAGLLQLFFRWISPADTWTLIHLGLPPRSQRVLLRLQEPLLARTKK